MLAFSAICPLQAQSIVSLDAVNSAFDEQHPVLAPNGDLFYTVGHYNGARDPGDIWMSHKVDDKTYQQPVLIAALSTPGYDVVVGFLDGENILIYHDGVGRKQGIHQYSRSGSSWSYKTQLDMGSFRNQSSHFSGRLSASGDVLILSLASFGSYGNEDIYVSFLKEGNQWTSPQNLGPSINTYQQEMTPYLSADKKWLFFSTNGHGSTQGIDIYYSQRLDDSWENWSQPQPISVGNTPGAELAYLPLEGETTLAMYTTTQNSEGYGDIQIMQAAEQLPDEVSVPAGNIEQVKTPEPEVEVTSEMPEVPEFPSPVEETPVPEQVPETEEEPEVSVVEEPTPAPFETAPVVEEKMPAMASSIKVLDINSLAPIPYAFSAITNEGQTIQVKGSVGEEAGFPVAAADAMEWLITSPGYLPLSIKNPSSELLKTPFLLNPASKGASIILEDVLFKRGTAEFSQENASGAIQSLAAFLKENPHVRILLEGHTDNVGNAQLNKELSLNRASAVRQLLVDQGVDFERIRIAGWGGAKPIASNQTEEGRIKNRRVEMVIQ